MTNVVGIMRYSVVTADHKRAFKATRRRSIETSLAEVLDPRRLRLRLALLEAMPLASLAGQTDGDFRLKVLISSEMPANMRAELNEVVARFPFVDVVDVRPTDELPARCREFVETGQPFVTFRIDDDDAVNREFIADLKLLAAPDNANKILSFPNGLYVASSGKSLVFQEKTYPNNAYGLSYFSDAGRTIFDMGSHSRVFEHPMVLHPRRRAWLRSIHAASDSGTRLEATESRPIEPSEVEATYPEFTVDAFTLLDHLPSLRPLSTLAIVREGVRKSSLLFAERSAAAV